MSLEGQQLNWGGCGSSSAICNAWVHRWESKSSHVLGKLPDRMVRADAFRLGPRDQRLQVARVEPAVGVGFVRSGAPQLVHAPRIRVHILPMPGKRDQSSPGCLRYIAQPTLWILQVLGSKRGRGTEGNPNICSMDHILRLLTVRFKLLIRASTLTGRRAQQSRSRALVEAAYGTFLLNSRYRRR